MNGVFEGIAQGDKEQGFTPTEPPWPQGTPMVVWIGLVKTYQNELT